MDLSNFKLGKKELFGGIILGIIVIVCTFLFLKFTNRYIYYQVIFDSNGGTEIAGQNILIGTHVKEPSTTTKEGYNFVGWYNGEKKFDFNTKISEDIVLTAKWEEIKPEVKEETTEETKPKEELKEEPPKKNEEKKQTTNPHEPATINVSNITLNTSNISMKVGESKALIAQISPDNATNKNIIWTSTNNGVATINNGTVTGINAGTAIITATADGKIATCTVTVEKNTTYHEEIIDTPGSAIGQCNIYIKSSEGVRVSGTIRINYTGGGSETVSVTPSGIVRVRNIIERIEIVSAG